MHWRNKMTDSFLECGIIPKGTQISINGIPFVLQEDVKGNASQEYIDKTIQDQNDFFNGIGVVSGNCE